MRSKLDQLLKDDWRIGADALERELLEQRQLEQLNQIFDYARRHSAYYQYLPKAVESLTQLAQLPFLTAKTLAEEGHHMLCVSQSEVSRVVTMQTSGTTGRPKRLYFTEADQRRTVDFFACGISELAEAGDRMLILMPGIQEGSIGILVEQALQKIGIEAVPCGPEKTFAEMAARIAEHQVNTIVGSPVQILSLARYMNHQGMLQPIKSVLASSDVLPETVKHALKKTLQCLVLNHYGITEAGLGFAIECKHHRGMHIREQDLLVEIIDPISGQVLPDGQWGELVFTTLTRQAMPLIRYRTGDKTRLLSGRCPCGSIVKRMDNVMGRIDAISERYEMARLDELVFTLEDILDYRAVYHGASHLLQLELIVVPSSSEYIFELLSELLKPCLHPGDQLHVQVLPWRPNMLRSLYRGKRKLIFC